MVTRPFGPVIREVVIQQDEKGAWKVDTKDFTLGGNGLLSAKSRTMDALEVVAMVTRFVHDTVVIFRSQLIKNNADQAFEGKGQGDAGKTH